jgi:hypothetical protein
LLEYFFALRAGQNGFKEYCSGGVPAAESTIYQRRWGHRRYRNMVSGFTENYDVVVVGAGHAGVDVVASAPGDDR